MVFSQDIKKILAFDPEHLLIKCGMVESNNKTLYFCQINWNTWKCEILDRREISKIIYQVIFDQSDKQKFMLISSRNPSEEYTLVFGQIACKKGMTLG